MAKIEIELDDKGEFVGQIPAEIDAILKRIDATAHGRGYQKAAEEAKPQILDGIKKGVELEIARLNVELPLERERFKSAQEELKTLQNRVVETEREASKTLRLEAERHAQEIVKRSEALKLRNEKIAALVTQTLGIEALKAGAREESLEELGIVFGRHIGFNEDTMEPFVKDETGKERLVAGRPLTLAAFVKGYLDEHPWHRRAPEGRGGRAPGGVSYRQPGGAAPVDVAAAQRRIQEGDRSADAINDLFNATRKRASG